MNNTHIIHYILEQVKEDRSVIRFMNRKSEYSEYRYPELWSDIKKYAEHFKKIGVKENEVVSILLPTCKEYLAAFFGAQLIKAIPVSLYPPTNIATLKEWGEKTQQMINSVNSTTLITDSKILSLCENYTSNCISKNILIEKVKNSSKDFKFDIEILNENDISFLQFSSGTTSLPKAVIINQTNVITNALSIMGSVPVNSKDYEAVSWLPLYHDMGLVGTLYVSIIGGKNLTLIRPDDFIRKPFLWLKAIHDHKANITVAPNFSFGFVQKRVSNEKIKELDLSSLKVALCGAEMIYRETMAKFLEHLKPAKLNQNIIMPVYGLAEATLAVTFTDMNVGMKFLKVNKKKLENRMVEQDENGIEICCLGKKLSNCYIKIVNGNGSKLPEKYVGKVLISGPSITSGYYNDTEKTKSSFIEGWLDTGDEGFMFNDELYICGRVKDTLIIRGKNVYPTTIEEKLFQIEGLRKGRIIVTSQYVEESDSEEVIVLAEASMKNIQESEKKRIIKAIKSVIVSESLPIKTIELFSPGVLLRTSSGKLKRKESLNYWNANKLNVSQARSFMRSYITKLGLYSKIAKNSIRLMANI